MAALTLAQHRGHEVMMLGATRAFFFILPDIPESANRIMPLPHQVPKSGKLRTAFGLSDASLGLLPLSILAFACSTSFVF